MALGDLRRSASLFFVVTVALPVGQLLVGSFFKFFGFYHWTC